MYSSEINLSYTTNNISLGSDWKPLDMDPFETLLDIERNCKANAVNIPRKIVPKEDWFGIGFRSSNFNFVCAMQEITEVLKLTAIVNIPGSHAWFKGVANLRGKVISVTDLQGFITGEVHTENELSRILVISLENVLYGFLVPQVLGIEAFFGQEVKKAETIPGIHPYLPCVQGAFERNGKPWIILSFRSLIKNKAFYHVVNGAII